MENLEAGFPPGFLYWARQTIPGTPGQHLLKVQEEHAELQADPSGEEAADLVLAVATFCDSAGIDLCAAMAEKFAKLRERSWLKQPDGTWHHA